MPEMKANAANGDLLDDSHRIEFTEPAYNASLGTNPEFVSDFVEVSVRVVCDAAFRV